MSGIDTPSSTLDIIFVRIYVFFYMAVSGCTYVRTYV